MIEHCFCGSILPHARTPECEKPRVRPINGSYNLNAAAIPTETGQSSSVETTAAAKVADTPEALGSVANEH